MVYLRTAVLIPAPQCSWTFCRDSSAVSKYLLKLLQPGWLRKTWMDLGFSILQALHWGSLAAPSQSAKLSMPLVREGEQPCSWVNPALASLKLDSIFLYYTPLCNTAVPWNSKGLQVREDACKLGVWDNKQHGTTLGLTGLLKKGTGLLNHLDTYRK